MHPYMLEKLAAARRDDYLSVAERHRLWFSAPRACEDRQTRKSRSTSHSRGRLQILSAGTHPIRPTLQGPSQPGDAVLAMGCRKPQGPGNPTDRGVADKSVRSRSGRSDCEAARAAFGGCRAAGSRYDAQPVKVRTVFDEIGRRAGGRGRVWFRSGCGGRDAGRARSSADRDRFGRPASPRSRFRSDQPRADRGRITSCGRAGRGSSAHRHGGCTLCRAPANRQAGQCRRGLARLNAHTEYPREDGRYPVPRGGGLGDEVGREIVPLRRLYGLGRGHCVSTGVPHGDRITPSTTHDVTTCYTKNRTVPHAPSRAALQERCGASSW